MPAGTIALNSALNNRRKSRSGAVRVHGILPCTGDSIDPHDATVELHETYHGRGSRLLLELRYDAGFESRESLKNRRYDYTRTAIGCSLAGPGGDPVTLTDN
jgi:hypothetical protein